MNGKTVRLRLLPMATSAIFLGVLAAETPAEAESAALTEAGAGGIEQVIVTGTRTAQRTVFQSTAPVDVIGTSALESAVSDELIDKMAEIAPSFNVRRLPMADGSVYVRPATLRGLSPDQTLVLIDGKRQHRSAFLGDNGAEGPDLNQIAAFAVGHIEVLRDGASAQYGSDAIAGVINIILDDTVGYKGYGGFSQYYEGDGTEFQAGAKAGFDLGSGGFVVGTLQWSNAEATSRTIQRADAIAYEAASGIKVKNPVQNWGQPDQKSWRAALNGEMPLSDDIKAYAFGTANWGYGMSDFNWRNPAGTSAYKSSAVYPDYDLMKIYPAGFSPRFGQHDKDFSAVAGIKGGGELTWDFSMSWGCDDIAYYISNTINASYGTDSPTHFYLGTLSQEEFNQNLDFAYALQNALTVRPITVAFGAERRQETYGIKAGETMSWATGPGAVDGLPSGANGFPGYSDDQAGNWSMQSYAGYLDIEAPITENWTVDAAGRYESFTEFGAALNGKVSTRYQIADGFALRGSYSTGFRAPTPGQIYSTRTSQGLDTVTLNLYTSGRLSVTSPVAQYFGAKPLQPEKSHNYSLGAAFDLGSGFTGSIDAYQVNIASRFGTSATYTVTDAIRTELEAEGVPGADAITSVNFFTNAYNTRTQGLDIVGTYATEVGEGVLTLTAAANFNYTAATKTDGTFSATTVTILKHRLPNKTANLSADYRWGRTSLAGKVRFYGPWIDSSGNSTGDIFQSFGSMVLFDLSASYDITDALRLSAGAENLFNAYPARATYQASRGLKYSRNAPYDTDGGQYFARLDVKF
jgi:iron complex outermembrane recepter protein